MKNLLIKYGLTDLFTCIPENNLELTRCSACIKFNQTQKDELEFFNIDFDEYSKNILEHEIYIDICKKFINSIKLNVLSTDKKQDVILQKYCMTEILQNESTYLIVSNKYFDYISQHNLFIPVNYTGNSNKSILEVGTIQGHKVYSTYMLEDFSWICINKDYNYLYYNEEITKIFEDDMFLFEYKTPHFKMDIIPDLVNKMFDDLQITNFKIVFNENKV